MRKLPEIRESETRAIAPSPSAYQRFDGWSSPSAAIPQRADLSQYWQILRRRRWAVALVTLLSILASLLIAMRTQRVYSSWCTIRISPPSSDATNPLSSMMSSLSNTSTEITTDISLMKTRALMKITSGMLKKKGINLDPEELLGAVTPQIIPDTNLVTIEADSSKPQTAAAIAQATGEAFAEYQLEQARQADTITQQFLVQELDDARNKLATAEINLQHFMEQHRTLKPSTTSSAVISDGPGDSSAGAIADSSSGAGGYSLAGPGGAGSADTGSDSSPGAGNDSYSATRGSSQMTASRQAQANPSADAELESAILDLADTRAKKAVLLKKVSDLKAKLDWIHGELEQHKAGAIQDSSLVRSIQDQLATKQDELAQAEALYTPQGVNHFYPGLVDQVDTLRKRLNQQLTALTQGNTVDLDQERSVSNQLFETQVEAASIDPQIAEYEKRVQELDKQAGEQPSLDTQLTDLTRDLDVLQHVYTMLLERQKQVEISEAAVQGNAFLVEDAIPNWIPVRPDRKKDVMLGLVLGLILGCSAAFLLEYLDNSVRSWTDVRDMLGMAALGAIPAADPQPLTVWQEGARSHLAEAYRMLRSNVSFLSVDSPVKTILVTSPGPGEGKSSTIANLACSLAQEGKRVVVIDADMRKPSLYRLLGGGRHIGLAEVLSGAATIEQALRQGEIAGVWTIPVDQLPPNPAELLSGQRVRDLIDRLAETFDTVLIDTPPCLMVTDAAVLASQVDAVILVVAAGKTSRESATRARDTLLSAHGRVVGVVLNRFQSHATSSQYYYYGDEDGQPRRRKVPDLAEKN